MTITDTMTADEAVNLDIDEHTDTEPVPTRDEVVLAIMAETKCTTVAANGVIDFWWGVVTEGILDPERRPHALTHWEMTAIHSTMDAFMPDDQVATPGSAHDLLERYLSDRLPVTERLKLTHINFDDQCGAEYDF